MQGIDTWYRPTLVGIVDFKIKIVMMNDER
jgi:hypothetical protein